MNRWKDVCHHNLNSEKLGRVGITIPQIPQGTQHCDTHPGHLRL